MPWKRGCTFNVMKRAWQFPNNLIAKGEDIVCTPRQHSVSWLWKKPFWGLPATNMPNVGHFNLHHSHKHPHNPPQVRQVLQSAMMPPRSSNCRLIQRTSPLA